MAATLQTLIIGAATILAQVSTAVRLHRWKLVVRSKALGAGYGAPLPPNKGGFFMILFID